MKKLFFLLSISLFLSACSLKSSYDEVAGDVTQIIAPETIEIGKNGIVEIHYAGQNGCSVSGYLTTSWVANEIEIEAVYFQPKDADVCPDYVPEFILGLTIAPQDAGELIIKAANGVADTVLVVEPE